MLRLLSLVFILSFISGCAISKHVVPVDSTKQIDKIYVLQNPRVFMDDFHGILLSQLEELGFQAETYTGDLPPEARYHMTYTANWNWDIAMYLVYFRANLYDDGRTAGEIEYDSKLGGFNLNKFGTTENIVRPLLQELFAKAGHADRQAQSYVPQSN